VAGIYFRPFTHAGSAAFPDYVRIRTLPAFIHASYGSDISIREIAADVGIQSASSYIRYFKKQYGITLSRYRLQRQTNCL